MDELIRVHLDIEGMKHSVLHAFSAHSEDVKRGVEAAVERVVKEFDFALVARQMAEQVLREAIQEVISEVARVALREKPFRAELLKVMSESLINHMAEVVSRSLSPENPPF